MQSIITWILICVALFIGSVSVALLAIAKKKLKLFIAATTLFFAFIGCGVYTLVRAGVKVLGITSQKIRSISTGQGTADAEEGRAMYKRLFHSCPGCVQIIAYQDAIVPVMDADMSLHVKTCPQEVRRILPKVAYTTAIIPKTDYNSRIAGDTVFKAKGDSIIYLSHQEQKAKLDIYIARDSTEMMFHNWW